MRGVKFEVLTAMVDFFYRGEANVCQKNLDNFLALAAELQLKGLEENQNKENVAESDLMKTVKDKSPNPLKRVKSNPKANPQDVVPNKYYDGERNCSLPSEETVIALSDQANYTDLENLDKTVRSMMTMSENIFSKNHGRARICTACGKEGNMASIMNHIESVHLSGLQIPCNICGKMVKSRHSLAIHKVQGHSDREKTLSLQ